MDGYEGLIPAQLAGGSAINYAGENLAEEIASGSGVSCLALLCSSCF